MDILSNFGERLKELLNYSEIRETDLSLAVGIDISQIRRYLRKECIPTLSNALKLADYFRCPLEYLFGRVDDFTEANYPPCPPFCIVFRTFLKENRCTRYRLSKQIPGLTQSRLNAWIHGRSIPTVENLQRLACHFGCTLDELVGREP